MSRYAPLFLAAACGTPSLEAPPSSDIEARQTVLWQPKWESVCDGDGHGTTATPSIQQSGGVADLHRVTLNTATYPDAVCNDGSAASMYVATPSNPTNEWVIHLQGGAACRDFDECLIRWCDQFDPSASSNDRQPRMMGDPLPNAVAMGGIMAGTGLNAFHDWNRVFIPYCSSDAWFGDATVTWADPNSGLRMDLEYRGQAILEAVTDTLAGGTWVSDDGVVSAPNKLGYAEEVLLSGTSAGGGGVAVQADRFEGWVQATGSTGDVHALIDAVFTPPLPNAMAEQEWLSGLLDFAIDVNSGLDASCVSSHGYVEDCLNLEHLIRSHLDVPAFLMVNYCDPVLNSNARDHYALASAPWVAGTSFSSSWVPTPGSNNTSTLIGQGRRVGLQGLSNSDPNLGVWGWSHPFGHVRVTEYAFLNSFDTSVRLWTQGQSVVQLGPVVHECVEPNP